MSLKTAITMRRYTYALIIITSIILGCAIINNASAYVIDHDNHSVWVQGNYGKLEATPHTITQSGWVYFNITPYKDIGNIDMVWGFNTSEVKPQKAEFYKPHWINWTTDHERFFWNVSQIKFTSDDCCCGNGYNTYKRKITYQTGYDNVTNESITATKTVCFDSYIHNETNYTIYWHTDHSRLENWIDVSNKLHSVNYNYDNKTKWWYVTNFATEINKTYTGRAWIDVPITLTGISGKYDFGVKRSSDSLHDAINNHRFYLLDPWFNSSWSTKRNLHINPTVHKNNISNILEEGYICNSSGSCSRYASVASLLMRADIAGDAYYRSYVEWDISSIPDDAIISYALFKYQGEHNERDAHITQMICKPSTSSDQDVYDDIENGTVYADQDGFPVVGNNQEINLGSNAISDLQDSLSSNWFAIGLILDNELSDAQSAIRSEGDGIPHPTLCIEYTTESESESLNYYQMNLNLSYSDMPEAQNNFSDIRFVNVSDGASLPYWIEDQANGSWCNVWINVTSSHAGWNNNTVALYYGNSEATSVSDGDATFEFFDDFEGSSLGSDWVHSRAYGTTTVANSIVHLEGPVNEWNFWQAKNAAFMSLPLAVCFRIKQDESASHSDERFGLGLADDPWHGTDAILMGNDGTPGKLYETVNEGTDTTDSRTSTYNDYINVEARWKSGQVEFYEDDVLKDTITTNVPDEALVPFLGVAQTAGRQWTDWIFVRKYVTNPPIYTLGAAQYLAGSIHYNTTNPYNHTIESDGTITANHTVYSADDMNWTALAVSDDCGLRVTQFNLSNITIANFTVYDVDLDWLRVTNLTIGETYGLKNSSGTVESYSADASGEINYTTDLMPGGYWIKILIPPIPDIIDTNYTITGNNALIIHISPNTTVTFTATSNQTLTSWYWTGATYISGDGTNISTASQHYDTIGVFYVTVCGEDSFGQFTDNTTWQINVGSTGGGAANTTYALIGTATPLGARKTTMAAAFVLLSGMFMMMLAKRHKEDEQDAT